MAWSQQAISRLECFLRVRKKGRNRYSESDKLPGHMKSYEHAAHEGEDRNLFKQGNRIKIARFIVYLYIRFSQAGKNWGRNFNSYFQ